MAQIGRPDINGANPFANIGIAKGRAQANVGEELNRISGYGKEQQFVDAKEHNTLGKDGFMKLLSHQLSNQDPLNPMDQKNMAAELAQFSQLEQLSNMNETLKKQGVNASAENKFYGASFIGKKVLTRGTTLKFDGQNRVNIPFSLHKDAEKVLVRIVDSKSQLVQQLELGKLNKGQQSASWNGLGLDKIKAAAGEYSVQVYAWDNTMQPFAGTTKSSGLVTGVSFENGETILTVDGQKSVYLRDVESFEMAGDNINNGSANKKLAQNAYEQIK